MTDDNEAPLWKGTTSQWVNLGPFCLALLLTAGIILGGVFYPIAFAALIIPLIWIIWSYLVIRCQVYELTSQRLRITRGIFNQTIDEIELYRVKDILLEKKWWMRVLGLGSLHLETSDRTLPSISIAAISGATHLREELRREVEKVRDKKRVRELDFEESHDDMIS